LNDVFIFSNPTANAGGNITKVRVVNSDEILLDVDGDNIGKRTWIAYEDYDQ